VIVAVALLVIGIGRSLAVTSSVVLVSAVVAALPFGCSVRLRGNCARCRSEFSSKRRAWSRRIYPSPLVTFPRASMITEPTHSKRFWLTTGEPHTGGWRVSEESGGKGDLRRAESSVW